jgi:hypothetical protein
MKSKKTSPHVIIFSIVGICFLIGLAIILQPRSVDYSPSSEPDQASAAMHAQGDSFSKMDASFSSLNTAFNDSQFESFIGFKESSFKGFDSFNANSFKAFDNYPSASDSSWTEMDTRVGSISVRDWGVEFNLK